MHTKDFFLLLTTLSFERELLILYWSLSSPFYFSSFLSSDVNDNVPFFLSSTYEATVPEGAQVGTSVAQVSATDLDSGLHGMVWSSHFKAWCKSIPSFPLFPISMSTLRRFTIPSWKTRAEIPSSSASTQPVESLSLVPLLTASRRLRTSSRFSRKIVPSQHDQGSRASQTQVQF